MARIHLAASRYDRCVQSLYSDDVHWMVLNEMLSERLERRPYTISVATNEKLGRVVGWLCCGLVGSPETPQRDGLAQLAWTVAAAFKAAEAQGRLARSSGEREHSSCDAQRMEVRESIVSRTKIAQSLAMKDDVYFVINNLATDPENDRGGVTSKLICSFTDSADQNGLSVFIQAPPFAVADLEWAGFQQIVGFEPQMDTHQLKFMVHRAMAR